MLLRCSLLHLARGQPGHSAPPPPRCWPGSAPCFASPPRLSRGASHGGSPCSSFEPPALRLATAARRPRLAWVGGSTHHGQGPCAPSLSTRRSAAAASSAPSTTLRACRAAVPHVHVTSSPTAPFQGATADPELAHAGSCMAELRITCSAALRLRVLPQSSSGWAQETESVGPPPWNLSAIVSHRCR
ncbi:hypothetical protein PVAP13_2KG114016 [Panicum virgatum]|uniref:Uncharacterized protein n=1 Tax=Panicum virgatum TaxID=38727 RepID=A0A8T0W080_PANVG|nr:hypothetical protein PVAP13_2KG114016 [Panicum virgatum]